jgi:hypothetical protein
MNLAENLGILESSLSDLKANRNESPVQNDLYEAVDYWCSLGRRATAKDTRVNYPARVAGELQLLETLRGMLHDRPEIERGRYQPLLERAEEFLREIACIPLPVDGHLGVLRIIRRQFDFLFDQYGFTVADEQPTNMRLVRGEVTIELGYATQSSLSFALSRTESRHFWIEDVLYLYNDERYRLIPQAIQLNTESDVDEWFRFISSVLRQHGDELLRNSAGAFDRLEDAQTRRDAEYAAMMNEKYGVK